MRSGIIVGRLGEGLLTGKDADEIRINDLWYRLPTGGLPPTSGAGDADG